MQRRQFLRTSGVVAGVGLAGCSAFSTEQLTPTTEEEENTVHLQYHDGDERVATVSLIGRWHEDARERRFPVRTHIWKQSGLDAESLRYEFRALQLGRPGHPPTYYLERFNSPLEPVQFARNADGDATVLEIPDLGFMGRGSISIDLLVENRNEEPFDLRMGVEVLLDGGRFSTDYELTGTATVEIPARTR